MNESMLNQVGEPHCWSLRATMISSSNDSLESLPKKTSRGSMTPFFFFFFGETRGNSSYVLVTHGWRGAKRVGTLNTRVKWLGWGENSKSGAPVTGRRRKSFTVVRKLACRGNSHSLCLRLSRFLFLAFCLRPFFAYWATIIPPLSLLSPRDKGRRGVNLCAIVSLSLLQAFRAYLIFFFFFSFQTLWMGELWRWCRGKLRVTILVYTFFIIRVLFCWWFNPRWCCFASIVIDNSKCNLSISFIQLRYGWIYIFFLLVIREIRRRCSAWNFEDFRFGEIR